MKRRGFCYLSISVLYLLISCQSSVERDIHENTIVDFYKVYNKRSDINDLLNYYHKDIVLIDIISDQIVTGRQEIKTFFDWDNTKFKVIGGELLEIKEIISSGEKLVVNGKFNKFSWGQQEFDPMPFTTIFTLDKQGKIIRQIDWINYPSQLMETEKSK